MSSGFSLEAASGLPQDSQVFGRIIVATPFANIEAVDRMHILTDEIHCLSIIENYIAHQPLLRR